jgi:hypothetical protein
MFRQYIKKYKSKNNEHTQLSCKHHTNVKSLLMLHQLQMGLVHHAIISVENKINTILLAAITNMFWTKQTAYVTVALLHF